jgi:hypothetical protein
MEITYDNLNFVAHPFLSLLAISIAGDHNLSNRMASYVAIPYYRLDDEWLVRISHRFDIPAGKNSSCI